MDRYLKSDDVLKTLRHRLYETALNQFDFDVSDVYEDIAKNRLETWVDLIPTSEVVEVVRCKDCENLSEDRIAPDWHRICRLQGVGKADDGFCDEAERKVTEDVERNVGKWTEKEVIHKDEAKNIIEEWQSCRCSICGHYDTRPYMYYFSEPTFCSWCGAEMREEGYN